MVIEKGYLLSLEGMEKLLKALLEPLKVFSTKKTGMYVISEDL